MRPTRASAILEDMARTWNRLAVEAVVMQREEARSDDQTFQSPPAAQPGEMSSH